MTITRNKKRIFLTVLTLCLILSVSGRFYAKEKSFKYEYGVFLGAGTGDIAKMKDYHIIVVDAMYFSKAQIKKLHRQGHIVYSYINPGSMETFRSYFDTYSEYILDPYENWSDEYWMDVSQKPWQDHMIKIAQKLKKKGVDGLFVDNPDVYYKHRTKEIHEGFTKILKGFKKTGFYVVINGGDYYVYEYLKTHKNLDAIIDGINQETIYSKILWDGDNFGKTDKTARKYFKKYTSYVASLGIDVYLLEYSRDPDLIQKIRKFCKKKKYRYYISPNLNLEL